MHYIRYDVLYGYVLSRLQYWSEQVHWDDEKLLQQLLNAGNKERSAAKKQRAVELKRATKRKAEVEGLFTKLYEDWSLGKITEYNFTMLSERFQTEQRELETKIRELQEALSSMEQTESDAGKWVELIKQYASPTELTTELLNTLIEKIVVHEAVKSPDGCRKQRDNYSIAEYEEAMRAKESVERETVEMKEHLEALTKRMKAYSLEADTLPVVKKAIDKEVNEINSSVKITRPLFGNEDVVQVPKSVWDKILKVFSWATFKQKTYDKVIAKNNTQEKEIQGLSGKLQEIKNYIRNRGLEKDYDNYIHRDDMEYWLARKRQEMKEMEQARLQKKTRSNREER